MAAADKPIAANLHTNSVSGAYAPETKKGEIHG